VRKWIAEASKSARKLPHTLTATQVYEDKTCINQIDFLRKLPQATVTSLIEKLDLLCSELRKSQNPRKKLLLSYQNLLLSSVVDFLVKAKFF